MAIHTIILTTLLTHPLLFLPLLLTPLLLYTFQTLYLSPISQIPGPLHAKLSPLYLLYHAYTGTECTAIHALHTKYGPIVRTSPTSIHISSATALSDIYSVKTGFLKPGFYANFDLDGHSTIFSAVDPEYRATRAKAVKGLFALNAIRREMRVLETCCEGFVRRLEREKERAGRGGKVDVLNLCRCLAIDVVTSYLFGKGYGGCEEDLTYTGKDTDTNGEKCIAKDENDEKEDMSAREGPKLSASEMVNSFVAVGRFWYLPPWLFNIIMLFYSKIQPDLEADASIKRVDEFLWSLIPSSTGTASSTSISDDSKQAQPYQSLLHPHITRSEVHAQCKDLIFAGTDSTATVLATILFNLSLQPSILSTLKVELDSDPNNESDPQTLPYLRGVVREGLRLAMPNPTRLPRVVPPGGWVFEGCQVPEGTVVGCSSFELHFDESVWADSRVFRPERWGVDEEGREMARSFIPFGLGPRQCIARNLATVELFAAVRAVVKSGVLKGSRPVKDRIEILEWFNSRIVGERIELQWT